MNASARECGLVAGQPVTASQPGLQARGAACARHRGSANTAALGVSPSSPRPRRGTVPLGHPRSSAQLEGSPGLRSLLPGASGKQPRDSGSLLGSGSHGSGEPLGPWGAQGGGAGGALWLADQHPLTLAHPFVPPLDHHAWDEERLWGCRGHPGGLQSRCEAGERGPIAAVLEVGGSPAFSRGPSPCPPESVPSSLCAPMVAPPGPPELPALPRLLCLSVSLPEYHLCLCHPRAESPAPAAQGLACTGRPVSV